MLAALFGYRAADLVGEIERNFHLFRPRRRRPSVKEWRT
jgi:hypothetical protein